MIGHPLILGDSKPTASAQDADLVAAAQAGDRAAFGQLYQRYAPFVHGVLLARVPWEDVDDLLQDVFVAAMERLRSLRSPAAFGGWLAAIARNRAIDRHRRARCPEDLDVSELADRAAAPPSSDTAAVLAAIRALPDAYRETLTLRLVEGLTGPEIAARTGLTPGSVRVNLHRGMRQLRERLAGYR